MKIFKNPFKGKHWRLFIEIIGLAGVIFAFYVYYNPHQNNQNIDEQLYGIWYSKYDYKVRDGILKTEGTTEYFKNNKFNFVGQISVNARLGILTLFTTYNVDATGSWSSNQNSFLTTMSDITSYPVYAIFDNKKLSAQHIENISREKFTNLEERYPSGLSEEFHVIELSPSENLIETDDLQGNMISISMKKQKTRFQR